MYFGIIRNAVSSHIFLYLFRQAFFAFFIEGFMPFGGNKVHIALLIGLDVFGAYVNYIKAFEAEFFSYFLVLFGIFLITGVKDNQRHFFVAEISKVGASYMHCLS